MLKAYSRKGCKNCKAKKKKCDEARPLCGNCTRSHEECKYDNSVFMYQPNCSTKKDKIFKKLLLTTRQRGRLEGYEAIKLSIEEFRRSMGEIGAQDELVKVGPRQPRQHLFGKMDSEISSSILNYNLRSRVSEVPSYVQYWMPFDRNRLQELNELLDPYGKYPKKNFHYHEDDKEVQEIIWLLFCHTKSCHNYVLVIDPENYCITKWFFHFCKTHPLIGYVVNSVTSNLLAERCGDYRWHQVRERCMDAALKALARTVQDSNSFTEMAICLLCIMFLFSERSAARSNVWRIHLKGALAILRKCDQLYSEFTSHNDINMSLDMKYALGMYAFGKNWFVAAETVACLSAPNGGAITERHELNQLLMYTNTDEENGIYIGGFNLKKGYSQSLTKIFIALSDMAIRVREEKGVKISGSAGILQSNLFRVEKELALILGHRLLEDVDQAEAEVFDLRKIQNHKLRACIRASHLCYCAALRIFIFAVLLDKSLYGPEIQVNVQAIEELLVTISCIELSGLCVHWPLFIGALCSPPGPQRSVFMGELKFICSMSAYVARNTVDRVEKAWKCIDLGELLNEDNYDCIVL